MTDINGKKRVWDSHKESDKRAGRIKGVLPYNSRIILEFLRDYELGLNVPRASKGKRKPSTLTKYRHQLVFFDKRFKKPLNTLTKREVHELFDKMMSGQIKKKNGKNFIGVGEFMKTLKCFEGWMLRTGKIKKRVCEDLSVSEGNGVGRKPSWVYLTNEQMKTLINQARGDYRALILFLYDSSVRPQEAYRLKVGDFRDDFTELEIPEVRENKERVSKTFGRTIKLKQSSQLLKEYVQTNNLKEEDYLIQIKQPAFNKYLRTLAGKLFGDEPTKARQSPNKLKLYDLRHNSCCFWITKYRTNSQLMYRFGWKKEDKIFYYSEFLGKMDKISDEDMITTEDKVKYEKEIEGLKKKIDSIVRLFARSGVEEVNDLAMIRKVKLSNRWD